MAKGWYVLSVFSGHENKVEKFIRILMEGGMQAVLDVKVPTEEVKRTTSANKTKIVKEKFLPGYILLEMDLPDRGWKVVLDAIYRTPGVMGILGQANGLKPQPISSDEAKAILQKTGEIKTERKFAVIEEYREDEVVQIKEGPFASFSGKVKALDKDRGRLTVLVGIFGQDTPVELEFSQVEKI
ncbi:MAG: transcription termination/antitermination protein NusG [Spirochaetaceae bacterium]|nr:transcription termination/antitermination protein NusG [Spirochaetaceae bacterium]